MNTQDKIDRLCTIIMIAIATFLLAAVLIGAISSIHETATMTGYERTATFGAEQFYAQETARENEK